MIIGIVFIVWGSLWLLQELGYIPADLHFFWPIILIAIGLSILLGRKRRSRFDFWWCEPQDKEKK